MVTGKFGPTICCLLFSRLARSTSMNKSSYLYLKNTVSFIKHSFSQNKGELSEYTLVKPRLAQVTPHVGGGVL